MATITELMAKVDHLIRSPSPNVLPNNVREELLGRALRDHSSGHPRFVILDVVAPPIPITEHALPATFTQDDVVQWIESPPDRVPQVLLEPGLQWRQTQTSTGFKIVFGQNQSGAYKLAYTERWATTNLPDLTATEGDQISLLAAHYCALSIASHYAHVLAGADGSPADLSGARENKVSWDEQAATFKEEYDRALLGDEANPKGPIITTREANVRRLGNVGRIFMPRGQIFFPRG